MESAKDEEAALRQLEQLELTNKAREAEDFLERVEEVHETIKGLIDGTVDARELERQQQRELWRKRAKEIREEEKAARAHKELQMGRAGKGEGKRAYTYFCRFCLVEFDLENLRCCNRCGRELQTRGQRVAELQQRVQQLKKEKIQHASRKSRWRRWLQTKKILKSSRLIVDYPTWEQWEPSTDEDEKQSEPPATPADDPNFQALERDLQASARSRAGRRAIALRCKEKGNCFFKNGDWLGALQAYEEGLEHARDLKELWTNKSLVLLKLQKYEEAHQAATRPLEYCEIFEDGYTQSAEICFKAFSRRALANRALLRFDAALEDLQQAAKLRPTDKQAQQLLQQTQQQVQQLRHLKELQQLSDHQPCEEHLRLNSARQGDLLLHDIQAAQPPRSARPATAAWESTPSLCGLRTKSAPLEGKKRVIGQAKCSGETSERTSAEECLCKSGDKTVLQRPPEGGGGRPAGEDRVLQVAGSNQPTSAATPASSLLSSQAVKKVVDEEGSLSTTNPRPPSSSPSGVEHEVETAKNGATTIALAAASPSTGCAVVVEDVSTSASLFQLGHTTAADPSAGVAALAAVSNASGTSYALQCSTKQLKSSSASKSSSFCPASSALSPPLASDAAGALKELQRLLQPAAAKGSFAFLDTHDLSAALQLLKFSPAKLAFCCSPFNRISRGTSGPSDICEFRSTSSSTSAGVGVCCSNKIVQVQRETTCSASEDCRTASGEKKKGESGKALQSVKATHVQQTYLDTCTADLRAAALCLRRQRRERAAPAAATWCILKKEAAAEQDANAARTAEVAELASLTTAAFDNFPLACFPALQLLHRVCFIIKHSEITGRSKGECVPSHHEISNDRSKHSRTNDNNSIEQICSKKGDAPAGITEALPWLLEVCESAAPYLLTIINQLLQLFVIDKRTAALSSPTRTEEELSCFFCNYPSDYTLAPHLNCNDRIPSSATPQATISSSVKKKTAEPSNVSYCCAWGKCAAAVATSMSLLLQLSAAPLTRRKLAEQLLRTTDGRALLLKIPILLRCCCCWWWKASASIAAKNTPGRLYSQEAGAAGAIANNVSASFTTYLPACLAGIYHGKHRRDTSQQVAASLAGQCLQQARKDAGALLCNMLLEQSVLQLLLPQRQTSITWRKNHIAATTQQRVDSESPQQQAGSQFQQQPQQHCSSMQRLHQEDGEKDALEGVHSQLQCLLGERLQAILQRQTLLQQSEEAVAALFEQLEVGVRPQQMLSLLWKQAALLQKQQQGGGSHTTSREKQPESVCLTSFNDPSSKVCSRKSSEEKTFKSSSGLVVGGSSLSSRQRWGGAFCSSTEDLISTLLLSAKELENFEAHAKLRAATDSTEEDPLLDEAQQALDIITNIARSPVGRELVLGHLQQELLQLLSVSSAAAAEQEKSRSKDYIPHRALNVAAKPQHPQARLKQQENSVECVLRELLRLDQRGNRSQCATFPEAVDVLGLLLNLTATQALITASPPRSFLQGRNQQAALTCATTLPSLQHQLLLSGETPLGVLPLLVPHIDRAINEQQNKVFGALEAVSLSASHASTPSNTKRKHVFLAGFRSLTLVSRLVVAVDAAAQGKTDGASAPPVATVKVRQKHQQGFQQTLAFLPARQQHSLRNAANAAQQQHEVPPGEAPPVISFRRQDRDLIACLLPRVLKLLSPPPKQQQARSLEEDGQEPRPLASQQQAAATQDQETWGELQNAALVVLCTLFNLNTACLLQTAATTPAAYDAVSRGTAAALAEGAASCAGEQIVEGSVHRQKSEENREHDECRNLQQQQVPDEKQRTGHDSALQEIGECVCAWLHVLKPKGYAHQSVEMRDPVARARGNFLLLIGHLAKAQVAAFQQELFNKQGEVKQHGGTAHMQREPEDRPPLFSQQNLAPIKEAGRTQTEEKGGIGEATTAASVVNETSTLAAETLQRELTRLDLRLSIECCVESLRKDVEGPQKNAAIALAAIARIPKYRPLVDSLKGFESLVQIAAPKLIAKQ